MTLWPFRPRLPRAAPLTVRRIAPPQSRVIVNSATRELLALWPGDTMMNDSVDLNPAMVCLVEKMRADRIALQHVLDADPKDFAEQNRLLAAFQSAVRSVDILHQNVEAPGPNEIPAAPPISLSGILENTTRALSEEDRALARNAAAMAVGA